jgi:serine/threonine protein phosphatase PrpC
MMSTVVFQVAGKSDIGVVRSTNEDNFGYDTRHGIFVVCDGMGGQAAGERASKIAVDTVLSYFREGSGSERHVVGRAFDGVSERANSLAHAIQMANQAIHDEATHNVAESGMGSTIVALLAKDHYFSIANVGDSRIYLLRDSKVQQLTQDHSLVMEQVRRGFITMEEAESSTLKNVIVRSLGIEESIEPDLEDHEFAPNDTLLLCSDGLSRFVSDETMLQVAASASDLDRGCEELIEAAKSGGSDDNITCVLIRARMPSRAERVFQALVPGKNVHKSQDSM